MQPQLTDNTATPLITNHPQPLKEAGWDAMSILERAAAEPCHRDDYRYSGTCAVDSGHDMQYACASCLAKVFLYQSRLCISTADGPDGAGVTRKQHEYAEQGDVNTCIHCGQFRWQQ